MNEPHLPNLLIEASAGTGKTYALVDRMIEQLRAGVEPRELVSLTFSRAAAGEIFSRFVGRLAEGAATNPADAALLRKVIATQHLSMIGTLDSFLMRLVKTFPLEMGLGGETEILDDYAANTARTAVSFGILRRTDRATRRAFTDAFRLARNHEDSRSFIDDYRKIIGTWHERLLSHPDAEMWGHEERIWPEGMPFPPADEADLKAAADDLRQMGERNPEIAGNQRLSAAWRNFADWVEKFRGKFTKPASIFERIAEDGEAFRKLLVEFKYYKDYAFGGADAQTIKIAVRTVLGYALRIRLETARGLYALLAPFEREYERRVRSLGHVTFSDLPRLISKLGELDRLAIEFRMDAKIRAWALDEFQDTSREQWQALGNLVHEAQADDQKETFIVGDRKQAIYGWRNGDVSIFARERSGGGYANRSLDKSWRYGPEICDAVNRVFMSARINAECQSWTCAEHQTAKPERKGYVKVVDAPGRTMEDFVAPVANELEATRPWEKGLEAAILVRGNKFGKYLAAQLKARGILDVAWEGESAVLDTPALRVFTDLVKLAEHPGDEFAWTHFRLSPLARAWYADGVPEDPGVVSAEFARLFTCKGMVRTFQALRAKLPEDPELAWSAFTEARFIDMLRAAAEFELALEPGTRLSDFEAFLEARTKRDAVQPGMVRIMTIHRSKGLTFDCVIVPLYEHEGLGSGVSPLEGDGGEWILPNPGQLVTKNDPLLDGIAEARREMDIQEALCIYYVAMTRAKYAVSMILMPPTKGQSPQVRFSDILRESGLGKGVGDPDFRATEPAQGGAADVPAEPTPPVRGLRVRVRRRLPSKILHAGMSAGDLFVDDSARQAAKDCGDAIHAEMQKVEFLESASDDFERALLKPEGFVELWREKAFEIVADGQWTSGQFDRIVFTATPSGRKAVIYDFKSNALRHGESQEDFARRMRSAYASQMASYRKAVVHLTGLPAESVKAVLLLTETHQSVAVD